MKLNIKRPIEENVIKIDISVAELGDSTRDAATELNQLHNFTRSIEYSAITFKANMKMVDGIPVVTSDEVDDTTIESVEIKDLVNKKYVIDENLHITLEIDITKIPTASIGTVFNSSEKIGEAMAVLFIEKVKAEILSKLTEIRALASDFEDEESVVL